MSGGRLRPVLCALGVLLAGLTGPGGARAQEEEPTVPVERVEVLGNQLLQKDTLLFYVSTKAGDRYDERRLKEDFRRLCAGRAEGQGRHLPGQRA
jgi:hypothetical protein